MFSTNELQVTMNELQVKVNELIAADKSPVILQDGEQNVIGPLFRTLQIAETHVKDGWNLFVFSYHTYFKIPVREGAYEKWSKAVETEKNILFDKVIEESKKFSKEMDVLISEHPWRDYLVLAHNRHIERTLPEVLEPEKYKTAEDIEADLTFLRCANKETRSGLANSNIISISSYGKSSTEQSDGLLSENLFIATVLYFL